MRHLPTHSRSSVLAERAAGHRWNPTPSELALWRAISACKLGVQFRRQQVLLGRFIVDFLCPSRRLVVEVDGGCHRMRRCADARRDRALERAGYRVLRLEAELVLTRLPEAVARVQAALRQPP